MFDYASHIHFDVNLKCFFLEKGGNRYDLCADGFQEAVIECEMCKF